MPDTNCIAAAASSAAAYVPVCTNIHPAVAGAASDPSPKLTVMIPTNDPKLRRPKYSPTASYPSVAIPSVAAIDSTNIAAAP